MEIKGGCGYSVSRRKSTTENKFWVKEEKSATYKRAASILMKPESDRSDEEKKFLFECSEVVEEVKKRIQSRQRIKERLKEFEDPPGELAEKCSTLASAIKSARHLVIYTGAGISTAACIPDYRGANGIWTLLQQGKDIGLHDLSRAEPTLTHMALSQLQRSGLVKHVVSQNCDGLHLRAALPRHSLSELHGNMYIEVCKTCNPPKEYWRLFDVTEHTGRFAHNTRRRCYTCLSPLVDTIVHFGERGTLAWPLNWKGACDAADAADMILCIGSSLRVLKKYPWLWCMDKPVKKRPNLFIVNLQWTPKDDQATLKINGRCDDVMKQVMAHLQIPIPHYDRSRDPIFAHATLLHPLEMHTTSRPALQHSSMEEKSSANEIMDVKPLHQLVPIVSDKMENLSPSGTNCIQSTNTEDDSKYTIDGHNKIVSICGDTHLFKDVEEAAEKKPSNSSVLESDKKNTLEKECEEFLHGKTYFCAASVSSDSSDKLVSNQSSKASDFKKGSSLASEITLIGDKHKCESAFSEKSEGEGVRADKSSEVKNEKVKGQESSYLPSDSKNLLGTPKSKGGPMNSKREQKAKTAKFVKSKPKVAGGNSDLKNDRKLNPGASGRTVANGSVPGGGDPNNSFGAGLCHYCRAQRGSYRCLYYARCVPVFANATDDEVKTPVCDCCERLGALGPSKKRRNSSSTGKLESKDEDEDSSCESPNLVLEPSIKDCGPVDKSPCPAVLTNPGWFGKGYRKRIKKKR
ncbi:NAD-dependent protein deacetylase Sirt7 [Ischnura elegans]|uniref:NAD-dependent protein deacetylase Sirt7 n=1 Tax=Ischnura elegans TaxID=197161 RepID=UPI001ED8A45C|nr:NAD-dependent protein deacetylase Sirt7 [Ischnura elegans]